MRPKKKKGAAFRTGRARNRKPKPHLNSLTNSTKCASIQAWNYFFRACAIGQPRRREIMEQHQRRRLVALA